MGIRPNQLAIKALFEQNHTFEVPKYQRGYAWDDQAVTDFVHDLGRCLARRANGLRLNHFFGGIVTVRSDVTNSSRSNYEVIDGQQRLASFVLLIATLSQRMRNEVGELQKKAKLSADEKKAKAFLKDTVDTLKRLYLVYRDSIELEYVEIPKLTLSRADNEFFKQLLDGEKPVQTRASHERLETAWTLISDFVEAKFFASQDLGATAKLIQLLLDQVLVEDCTVIFMASDTRSEAYQIFQVLNDRGVQLTDGDLLRARTMELLDDKALTGIQDSLATTWDEVLAYPPSDTDSYLRWYFSSLEGRRPSSSGLADQFLASRFKVDDGTTVSKSAANAMLKEAKQMNAEFALLATMGEGEWPLPDNSKVLRWDRERLRMLVAHLKHTNAMPLLLSLRLLGAEKLATAVASIERFVFRYKTVGNAHISPMTELYLRHAKRIREGADSYKISALRTDLSDLLDRTVPTSLFDANLRQIKYNPRGGNGHIRYLLITLEDYLAWYEKGANGMPKCRDKTRLFDFSNTTLEHVYPRNAKGADKNPALETVKDRLGNLMIFGPGDNESLGNKVFAEKRNALRDSSIRLNRIAGEKPEWRKKDVNARTDDLVKMALKVFVP